MEEAQQQEVSRKAMAFESISGSVVTEHTGDNQGEEGEYFDHGAARSENAASSSVANSSNGDGTNKIREHDYIGLNGDSPSLAAVDKPDEERSNSGPDLNLGLGLSLSKNKEELLHGEDKEKGAFHRFKPPVPGCKRGYLEAVGLPDLPRNQFIPQMFKPWRTIEQPRVDAAFNPFHSKPAAATAAEKCEEAPSSSPVVGWPPVQSFRKNTLVTSPPAPKHRDVLGSSADSQAAAAATAGSSLFVKVYMDGVPIGRKVDLETNNSYPKLSLALKDMFSGFINGQNLPKLRPSLPTGEAQQQINLFDGHGAEYVLTYEDKDGDLMLVGDVPWRMFAATVKRLRIMKGSDAIGLSVPKDSEIKVRS